MIIDLRCRLPTPESAVYFGGQPFAESETISDDHLGRLFLGELDRAGIDVAVSPSGHNPGMDLGAMRLPARLTPNDRLAEFQRAHPQRFIGVVGLDVGNQLHDAQTELKRGIDELGLRAVTMEPGRAPLFVANPADERLYPYYELLQQQRIPLILQTSGLKGGRNLDYAHPRWIDRVAVDFPELHLICAHGCVPFARELMVVVRRHHHVYAAPNLYVFYPGGHEWVEAVNDQPQVADKFLFGSGYPVTRDLARFVERFLGLPWKPKVLDRILYRNAIRALALTDDPCFGPIYLQPDHYTRHYFARRLLRRGRSAYLRVARGVRRHGPRRR